MCIYVYFAVLLFEAPIGSSAVLKDSDQISVIIQSFRSSINMPFSSVDEENMSGTLFLT